MSSSLLEQLCNKISSTCTRMCNNCDYIVRKGGQCPTCFSDDLMHYSDNHGPSWHVEDLIPDFLNDAGIESVNSDDFEEQYDDFLRDVFGDKINVCGYEYDTAETLRDVDPTAYNIGFSEWYTGILDEEYI